MTHYDNITDAIDRSRSHNEITHVDVTDAQATIAELRSAAESQGLEFDWADTGEWVDAWAYEVDAPEGEMVWRLGVHVLRGEE